MKAVNLYWINLPYACFGIATDRHGKVIETAPIAKWMLGKSIEYIINCVRNKDGEIIRTNYKPNAPTSESHVQPELFKL